MRKLLPIMIGCYEEADKCTVVTKDKEFGGYSLFICRLKKSAKRGSKPSLDDIKNVIVHIHFCKFDALREFKNAVDYAYEQWGMTEEK